MVGVSDVSSESNRVPRRVVEVTGIPSHMGKVSTPVRPSPEWWETVVEEVTRGIEGKREKEGTKFESFF